MHHAKADAIWTSHHTRDDAKQEKEDGNDDQICMPDHSSTENNHARYNGSQLHKEQGEQSCADKDEPIPDIRGKE